MSRISTSQKPSPMNSQLFCGKKTTNFGFRVGAGRGGAAKDILKQLSPNLQNFKIHGRFFLSFFFTSSGSGKSPDPKIHEHFSCLCLSLSLAHARTRTPPPHALPSRVYFVSFLKDSEVSQVQQKQVTILDSFRFSFFSSFSALIPNFIPFFSSSFSFLFFFFWFFFFERV